MKVQNNVYENSITCNVAYDTLLKDRYQPKKKENSQTSPECRMSHVYCSPIMHT